MNDKKNSWNFSKFDTIESSISTNSLWKSSLLDHEKSSPILKPLSGHHSIAMHSLILSVLKQNKIQHTISNLVLHRIPLSVSKKRQSIFEIWSSKEWSRQMMSSMPCSYRYSDKMSTNTVGDDADLARPSEVVAPVVIMKNQGMVAQQILVIHINLLLSLITLFICLKESDSSSSLISLSWRWSVSYSL